MKTMLQLFLFVFVLWGENPFCRADDALDVWHLRSTNSLNTVRFVGGIFVGVGDKGRVATSPDGTVWSFQTLFTGATMRGVTFGPDSMHKNYFVVVGGDYYIWISTNAVSWEPRPSPSQSLTDVASKPGSQMFVTTEGSYSSTNPVVYYSSDLMAWSRVNLPTTGWYYSYDMQRVSVADGTFFAAGAGGFDYRIWRSTDGINWTYACYANQYAGNFVYGNGMVAFVGNEGCPLISTDLGLTWSSAPTNNVCPYNCAFCYMGLDVTFGNSTFVTIGFEQTSDYVKGPLTSTNLSMWQRRTALDHKDLRSIAYGNGTFVAVGPDGIYQSEPVLTPSLTIEKVPGTNTLLIHSSGEVGRGYRLQFSSNFTTWTDLHGFTNTLPTMELMEWPDSNCLVGYYRVVTP